MEQQESVFESSQLDHTGQEQLKGTGKWAKFIGIVYLVIAGLLLLISVFLFANLNSIANALMEINGMNMTVIEFMLGAGKWLFVLFIILSCVVLGLNGYFLLKFGNSAQGKFQVFSEETVSNTFLHLGRYMMLTTVLSIISTVLSVLFIIYYLVK